MKTLAVIVGSALLVLAGTTARSGENLKGLTAQGLMGQYRIVSGEEAGKPIPASHHLQDSEVEFTPENVIVFDKDRKKTYAAKYKLVPGKEPTVIQMTSILPKEGMKADGLIKRQGDVVTIIYALPTGTMPTEFKTQGKQLMLTLKTYKREEK